MNRRVEGQHQRLAWTLCMAAWCVGVTARCAGAQELEPGAYTVSPVGVNLFNAGYTFNKGDVTFDPSVPAEDVTATIHTVMLGLGRAVSLAGRSATVLVSVPLMTGHLEGLYLGQFTTIDRTGLGDLRLRLGVSVWGAPARKMPEFARTPPPRTNLSVGLTAVAPTGQYDPARVINLGSHRWSFKPEGAITRTNGRWMVEFYGGVWLFTANDELQVTHTQTREPLLSTQLNLRYTFKPSLWISANANYYTGGRTSVDGRANSDLQTNSRLGTTLSVPMGNRNSIRFAVSDGAYTTIGGDFLGLSMSFQRVF